jgi:glycerol-3-phosphate O-acyltransferase
MQKLLKWEFLCRKNIQTREEFNSSIKVLTEGVEVLKVAPSGEVTIAEDKVDMVHYMTSLIYPFIDGYWVTLTFLLKFMLGKMSTITIESLRNRIQWLAETLHDDGYIKFYESCSMDVIKTSIYAVQEMGVLKKEKITKTKGRNKTKETIYSITDLYLEDQKLYDFHS